MTDPLTRELLGELARSTPASAARNAFIDAWRGRLAAAVRRTLEASAVSEERTEASLDPDRIALTIIAALHGGAMLSRLARDNGALEAALDIALAPLVAAVEPQRLRGEPQGHRPSMGG